MVQTKATRGGDGVICFTLSYDQQDGGYGAGVRIFDDS